MMHASFSFAFASLLAGIGTYTLIARRHAIMALIGAEMLLASAGLVLVTVDAGTNDIAASGQTMTLFLITIAAAEMGLALAVILLAFRHTREVALPANADRELDDVSYNSGAPDDVDVFNPMKHDVVDDDTPGGLS